MPRLIEWYYDGGAANTRNISATLGYGAAQCFECLYDITLAEAKFYVQKIGAATGTVYAKLYAMTGTCGTTGKPTGSALATSTGIDITTISAGWNTFTFTSDYELAKNTYYCITVEYNNGDGTKYLEVYFDSTSPTHAGNMSYISSGSWLAVSTYDCWFYLYGKYEGGGMMMLLDEE